MLLYYVYNIYKYITHPPYVQAPSAPFALFTPFSYTPPLRLPSSPLLGESPDSSQRLFLRAMKNRSPPKLLRSILFETRQRQPDNEYTSSPGGYSRGLVSMENASWDFSDASSDRLKLERTRGQDFWKLDA